MTNEGESVMKKSPVYAAFCISLMVVGVLGIVTGVCNIAGIELPDIVVRIIGIVDIIAVPVLSFSFVRLFIMKKDNKE